MDEYYIAIVFKVAMFQWLYASEKLKCTVDLLLKYAVAFVIEKKVPVVYCVKC